MTETRKINPRLKAGLEFGPPLLFFAVFMFLRDKTLTIAGTAYSGFIVATLIFIPVLIASTLALWRLTGKLAPMQIATLVLVVVFGGLTVWLNDPKFFKMKPTIIYLIFAGLLGFGLLRGRNWLELVMSEALPMRPEGWRILTLRMILLFLGLALVNELVWRSMSETAWVNFKTFGLTAIMVGFFVANSKLFERYALPRDGE